MPDTTVDTCCVLNLYASGNFLPLLESVNLDFHVPKQVVEESQYIRQRDPKDPTQLIPLEVDLDPAIQAGLLHPCQLEGEDELAYFVQLATTLDDGEAACLAIAKVRGWGLVTDDRIARREAIQLGVEVITTAELVKGWSEAQKVPIAEVAQVLQNIRLYSRFEPNKNMPLYEWWLTTISR